MIDPPYFNRDISWLTFNRRVLEEAANERMPVMERIRFLSIFSSNLDEFYRVRFPVIKALKKIGEKNSEHADPGEQESVIKQANNLIFEQQTHFGQLLTQKLIPALSENKINLVYNNTLPEALTGETTAYFLSEVLAFLQPVYIAEDTAFFPENNKLYFLVQLYDGVQQEKLVLLNIPSDHLPRFFSSVVDGVQHVCFLDDIIRANLSKIFRDVTIGGCYSIKITRDAELDLKDEYSGELSEQIEKQLQKRDKGLATRFLYQAEMPLRMLQMLNEHLGLQNANAVEGGQYHNLKDFYGLPVNNKALFYNKWPELPLKLTENELLADIISRNDLLVNTPYQSYDTILRFFNEAAVNPAVEEINVTLYRVASDSKIVNALISAVKNGKTVKVVIELKARFDEENNLKWAKKMKNAGVQIIYSVTALKVHAKIALVKTRCNNRLIYTGLLATGNFNEGTARFYTDHILLTANHKLLREVELLFIFLAKREKPTPYNQIDFNELLVAGFNLHKRFIDLIDREIDLAKNGHPASITIKLNNLEEWVLIDKLYEASMAGVKIRMIVRSICCLVPGLPGLSENICIKRIVDRYLEHGRIFIFGNGGNAEVFMGSADWMNRNIYHRIEVCFPVEDSSIKKQVTDLIEIQWSDTEQAVIIDDQLNQVKPVADGEPLASQEGIYQYLKTIV
ncbi:polyphosphate kinase 1 [Mucilaginibacter sp.]|uniref:polyphosphate kinase 1 n=1 Tax=Mucilaginibacter sp. TaxID=1882438 RepID=UPI000CC61FD6|nr:polyphosphate kinase 1 [Mucilaginibacter sp.]PLW88331.1 MAG: polyphosphate kinase 1 [Mucilaginibacter sp.]PMP64877.1 MAG: polyphosphate kinase 1 [Mucilaginibacter sp.]HEK22272.1 polyphosphate kinase 1 [Bacteroidota bacterium]